MQLLSVLLVSAMLGCVSSLQCYICNSITQPDCVDNYEKFLKPCPVKSFGGKLAQKPIACRVYRQSAAGENSIVRECAYSGSDVVGKNSKGSMGISRTITQCSDKPACNFSPLTFSSLLFLYPFLAYLLL